MRAKISRVSILGLPGSGKTTLLAAMWHVVNEPGCSTRLTYDRLSDGNYEHLNALAKRWRAGEVPPRTETSGMKTVSMRLKDSEGHLVELSFPDVPGEEFTRMWEKRELDELMAETLTAPALVLLINGDKIKFPAWIVERAAVERGAGIPKSEAPVVEWSPDLAPTQVQVVELLQFLMTEPLDIGPRRLAVLISIWDKAEHEELTPSEFLAAKLPLLDQYLQTGRDPWDWRVWGLSAQGGDYDDPEKAKPRSETESLLELDRPSDRIKMVDGDQVSTDVTLPIHWLVH